jgi:maleylpyruvate isomerase
MPEDRGPDPVRDGDVSAAGPPAAPAGVARSTGVLLDRLAGLDDAAARAASALPGWSRGHVLTHLARHADAQARIAYAALESRLVPPYADGPAGRAAEIEAGSGRGAGELVADVRDSADRLAAVWRAVPADAWSRPTMAVTGTRPLAVAAVARWVEVELHHLDLDRGHDPEQWPADFVRAGLDYVLAGLPARRRADPGAGGPRRWWLSSPDLGLGWLVEDGADGARVTAAGAAGADGHVLEADGPALLCWLTGRGGSAAVSVVATADAAEAVALPRVFPFP